MPTDAEQLALVKSQILARLVELTDSPKVTYTIDGENWKWNEYFDVLTKQLKAINEQIAAQEPFTIVSQGDT